MSTVFEFCDRVELIDPVKVVRMCIEQTSPAIVVFNKEQLHDGITSADTTLKPYDAKLRYYGTEYPFYRKQYYRVFKNEINPAPGLGNPDLYLTGSFYQGIGVVVTDTTYTVSSDSENAERLEIKYGSQIYGLTPQNKAAYCAETLKPAIITNLKTTLRLI